MNSEKFDKIVADLLSLQIKTYYAPTIQAQVKSRGWHSDSLRLAPKPRQARCEICGYMVDDRPILINIIARQRTCSQLPRKCPLKPRARSQLGKY